MELEEDVEGWMKGGGKEGGVKAVAGGKKGWN